MRGRALLGALAVAATALGLMLALALGPGARPARAALPCGLLNPCSTTTATTPTAPTTPTPTPTTVTSTPTTTAPTRTPTPAAEPGATYDGRSGNFARAATVTVSASGHQLRGWFVQFEQGSCSDGGRYAGDDVSVKQVPLSTAGSASETVSLKPGHAFWHTKAGKRVVGAERYRAHFSFTAKTVTGTLEDTFSSAKLSCHSGVVHFTAHRDGTPQAPVRTYMVDTGVYRATGETVDVYDPWKAVTELKARYTLSCPKVKAQHYTLTLYDLPLSFSGLQAAGYFGDGLRYSSRLSHGITAKETIDVSGQVEADVGARTESYLAHVSIVGSIEYFAADGAQIDYSCGIEGGRTAVGPKHLPLINPDLDRSALGTAAGQLGGQRQ